MKHTNYSVVLLGFALLCAALPAHAQCPITVNAGDDILLCPPPTPVQLNGDISGDYLSFSWTPTTGLTGANTLTPTATVTQSATYVLRAKAVIESINLINNGDFGGGNSGFSTSYNYSPGDIWLEGTYDVLSNPQTSHSNFAPCGDHTGGGDMMAVNGNGTANINVWCQTITVLPNTEYAFSAWATSLVAAAPAVLQFSVNGINLGTPLSVSPTLCNWQQFYALWNSGGSTTANICIVNMNTVLSGNDFAIDDIAFSPVCVVTDTVKITIASIAAVASPSVVLLPCEGTNTTLSGVGSSTGPGYSYAWSTLDGNIVSGGNTLAPVVDAAGQYTLTVTYTNGADECTKTATVNVVPTPNPLINWITPPQPLGCGGNTVTLLGNSNQSNVNYAWSTTGGNIVSGANNKNCVVNQTGVYTLVITHNVTGCTATTDVLLTASTNPPLAVANSANAISCLQATAALNGTGSSVGSGITYLWQSLAGSSGSLTGPTNGLMATATTPGTFVLGVTNTTNGCTSYDTVIVTNLIQPPALAIPLPDTLDCLLDSVAISVGATPTNVTFSWSTTNGTIAGSTTGTGILAIAPGTYQVVATNPINGCTSTLSAIVLTNLVAPIAAIQLPDSLTCQQTSVVLSGAGSSVGSSMAYQWTGGNVVSGANTLLPIVNAAGNYTLVVTNAANGCTHSATTTVFADANAITAVANAPDTLDCTTALVAINANGSTSGAGFTYQWTTTNGLITNGAQTPAPQVAAPGTYTLLLTNPANGCTSTALATVLQDLAPPAINMTNPAPITCAQPNTILMAQATGNAIFTWVWSTLDGQILSGGNTATPLVGLSGTYAVTATNTQNGCTATATTTVTATDQLPSLAIVTPTILNCNTTNIALQLLVSGVANATPQIQWSTANGQISAGSNTANPTVNAAGMYQVTVTNPANGCSAQSMVTVQQDTTAPALALATAGTLTCAQPLQNLVATLLPTNTNFIWSTTNGHFSGPTTGGTVTVDQAGTYQIVVTNTVNGCTNAAQVQVQANQTLPTVQIALPNVLTCTQVTTSLLANVAQAGPTPTIQWSTSNGAFTQPTNAATTAANAPGTYQIQVTNPANGCTATALANITQDTIHPTLGILANAIVTCATPVVPLLANIGNAPANVQFQWSTINGNFANGSNTLSPNVDQGGTYSLLATNPANGCTAIQNIDIQQNTTLPNANAGLDAVLLCSTPTLLLNGTATNAPNFQMQWSSAQPNAITGPTDIANPTIVLPGTFVLLVTNPTNGCTDRDTVLVAADVNQPSINAATPALLTCTQVQVSLGATVTAANPNSLNLQWSTTTGTLVGSTNTPQATATAPGIYTLTATDATNGCSASATVVVQANTTPPQASAGNPAVLTCDLTTANLQGSSNLPAPAAGFSWASAGGGIVSGQNLPNATVNAPGTYLLTVTNLLNGCTSTTQVIVTQNTTAPVPGIAVPTVLTCTQAIVVLPATSTPAAVTASWTTQNGNFTNGQNSLAPTVNAPGTYVLLVENTQNGCTATAQVQVTENKTPPTAEAGSTAQITCAVPVLNLVGTATAPNATATLQWSTSGGNIVSGSATLQPMVNSAGTYTLTATNPANGCTASDQVSIGVDTLAPGIVLLPPAVLTCTQAQVNLQASAPNTSSPSFVWATAQGNIVSGQNTSIVVVNAAASYALTVTNPANGCSASQSVAVVQNIVPPTASIAQGGILHCNQETLALPCTTTQAGNTPQYQWSTANGQLQGATSTATATVAAAGLYQVVVTNAANGCTATATATIAVLLPPNFVPLSVQPDCIQPLGSLDFGPVTQGAAPFSFSFDNGDSFGQIGTKNNLAPGVYQLVVEDAYGCTAQKQMTLQEPAYPSVTLPVIYQIVQGDSVQLNPQTTPPAPSVQAWAWTEMLLGNKPAPPGLGCTDCPKPWVMPLRTSQYTITITDGKGCTASATTRVEVDGNRRVFIPNVLTPSSNDDNARFTVFGRGVVEIEILQVFDRWGALVWQGKHLAPNDTDAGWDGSQDSKDLQSAVFVWTAVIVFPDGEKEVYSGDLTVVR